MKFFLYLKVVNEYVYLMISMPAFQKFKLNVGTTFPEEAENVTR